MLTEKDVTKLLANPSGEARVETIGKIASAFSGSALSDGERKIAEEIFRIMVKDAEVRVREALSENLKQNPDLPHDVAISLAKDVDSVALPVLKFSDVLNDEDLIEIVRSQGVEKQKAIAGRVHVSENVSSALVETEDPGVVSTLVSNEGARISEHDLGNVVESMGDNENVKNALAHRPKLPVTISERLLTLISNSLQEELSKRGSVNDNLATDLILQSRERAIISLSSEGDQGDVMRLVRQLHQNDRLTPSIVLRGLCMGDLDFFEASIAELAAVPLENARALIQDPGKLGIKAAFDKAALPQTHFPAARAAVDVIREMEYDGGANDRERYSRRMLERILTQYDDLGVEMEANDLDYLLKKMDELPQDSMESAA